MRLMRLSFCRDFIAMIDSTAGSAVKAKRSPHFPRGIDDQLKLLPLLVLREQIAFHRGGKAALRTERQVFQRHILARFVDSALKLSAGF